MKRIKQSGLKMGSLLMTLSLVGLALPAWAFDSGSSGADGAFSPTVNTELLLPESGVFNFSSVNIPAGVEVTFKKNTTNTPVVILVSGDVAIAGTINVDGGHAMHSGAGGDGNIGDDGIPGMGGPGGYDGGRGGEVGASQSGLGLGPGGGRGGKYYSTPMGGAGGSFGSLGANAGWYPSGSFTQPTTTYGSSQLLPLIGGSGGGGGAGGSAFKGAGGGGGGGALLIASSGTVSVTGAVLARGGSGGVSAGAGRGANGAGGSGGGIRIVATTISGNGAIAATGGGAAYESTSKAAGAGGKGRIRLEAETFTRTAASDPGHSFSEPTSVFVAGLPSLRISSVAGVAAPASPTGNADITLPSDTTNPVTVAFETTNVPTGNIVTLKVVPAYGDVTSVISPAIAGSDEAGTASVSVTLPAGPSVLSASTTYTITTAMSDTLSPYADGERIVKVRLDATMNGPTLATLITESGKEVEVPQALLATFGS